MAFLAGSSSFYVGISTTTTPSSVSKRRLIEDIVVERKFLDWFFLLSP